jgi:hypothetical protein
LPFLFLDTAVSFQCTQYLLCAFDIRSLRRLIPADEQQVNSLTSASELDAIARPEVDPHLADTFAHRFAIAEIA